MDGPFSETQFLKDFHVVGKKWQKNGHKMTIYKS
jgi:hypothetical protein